MRPSRASARLVVLALAVAAPARAYVRTTTKSSNPPCPGPTAVPLQWRQVVIPYVVDAATTPDVPGGAVDAVRASFQTWDDVASSYVTFRFDGTMANAPVGYVMGGPNENVVKWIESNWSQSTRAIAVTLNTFDCNSGEIFDADILLNGQNFLFTIAPTGPTAADVQNTVTHEVGHLLGFDHAPDPESTMYADAPLGETKKRDLTADDAQGMCDVYGLGHEPADAGPPDAAGPDAGSPRADDGGCAVAGQGAGGRGLLLVLLWAAARYGPGRRATALISRAFGRRTPSRSRVHRRRSFHRCGYVWRVMSMSCVSMSAHSSICSGVSARRPR
ncbi:MAG TPA: matrixin family metalloprotease [Haliangiales bacterium]|nr:matrixin family metalloprotease [Haliangiales bacterium]